MKGEIIMAIIAVLFIGQFLFGVAMNPDSEFGGADGEAEDLFMEMAGEDYETLDSSTIPKFEPPGGETESLLFALQAAIGALIIGYFFGYYRGKGKSENK